MPLANWPFTPAQVRKALGLKDTDPADTDDLADWAQFVTELVDQRTGRVTDPERHLITITTDTGTVQAVPHAFVMAARVTARLLWRQERNGGGSNTVEQGVPLGADMPAKAASWLADYPAEPMVA